MTQGKILGGAVAVLAVEYFGVQPLLERLAGEVPGALVYVVFRAFVFVAVAYALTRWAGRNRFQALTSVMMVGVVDQVIFKFLALSGSSAEVSAGIRLYGLAVGYVVFIPILLLFALLGVETARKFPQNS